MHLNLIADMPPKFEDDARGDHEIHNHPVEGIHGHTAKLPSSDKYDYINRILRLELETPPPTSKMTRKLPIPKQIVKDIIGAVGINHDELHDDGGETEVESKEICTTVNISPPENQCSSASSGKEEHTSNDEREVMISKSFSSDYQRKETSCFYNEEYPSITHKSEKKSVQFHSLHIRTYNRVVGDHPCCTTGLPITLGWDYNDLITVAIDEYETRRRPRKNRRDMKLDCDSRWQILSGNCEGDYEGTVGLSTEGYSESELKRAGRKLYRERQRCAGRSRSRMNIVERFFMTT